MSFTVEQLKGDLQLMTAQRDQSLVQYHQQSGSVVMLEAQVKFLEEEAKKESEKVDSQENTSVETPATA
jgi:hypothetical protein